MAMGFISVKMFISNRSSQVRLVELGSMTHKLITSIFHTFHYSVLTTVIEMHVLISLLS